MKTGAIIRIIGFALIALVLVGVMVYYLTDGGRGAQTAERADSAAGRSDADASFGGERAEAPAEQAPQLETVDFASISKLEIRWTGGGVTIESTSGDGGFAEDYTGEEKYRMRWHISGDTRVIKDFSEDLSLFLNVNLPSKNLTVSLPRAMQRITVVTTSAEVTFTGGAESQKLDVSTVSGGVSGVLARADEADVETVSGRVDLALGRCGKADISTTSGSVRFACYQGLQEAELDSVSGALELTVPRGSSYTLDWDTVSGSLHDETGAAGGFGGAGTVEIDAETVSGSLTLRSAAEQELP